MSIIDGKKEAEIIFEDLASEISNLSKENIFPKLAIILIGDYVASEIYVKVKLSKAKHIGIQTELIRFNSEVSEDEILDKIDSLNNDDSVNAIIVQLPIPDHIDQSKIQAKIVAEKDVDAFNPYNVGMLYSGFDPYFIPPTPHGVLHLIKTQCKKLEGKDIVIVGKSNIVGKPLASLLMKEHATVSVCHSLTKNLADITKRADIVVTATGATEFFTKEYFTQGQIVIDVGISRKSDDTLVGDVAFDEVSKIVSHISPVPGGVGPMTIAYLMANTVEAAKNQSHARN